MSNYRELLERRHADDRRLTPKQVRRIRLSSRPARDLAPTYGITSDAINKIRRGMIYGNLAADEKAAQADRTRTAEFLPPPPDEALTISLPFPVLGRPDLAERFDEIAALDAAGECKHGRLPGDRTEACGCWPQEPAQVVRLRRFAKQAAASPSRVESEREIAV